jgi:hypothetical protein
MPTQTDVRKIALSFEGAYEEEGSFSFAVVVKGKVKRFAWVWRERLDPKLARVPNPKVIGVHVAGPEEKAALLAGDPERIFTEPHYNGYPAVLVRLAAVSVKELRALLASAYESVNPSPSASPPPRGRARS